MHIWEAVHSTDSASFSVIIYIIIMIIIHMYLNKGCNVLLCALCCNIQGTVSVGINATDLFDDYGQDDEDIYYGYV